MSDYLKECQAASNQDSPIYKDIWNAAIDAVIKKLKSDFYAPDIIIAIVKEVKK